MRIPLLPLLLLLGSINNSNGFTTPSMRLPQISHTAWSCDDWKQQWDLHPPRKQQDHRRTATTATSTALYLRTSSRKIRSRRISSYSARIRRKNPLGRLLYDCPLCASSRPFEQQQPQQRLLPLHDDEDEEGGLVGRNEETQPVSLWERIRWQIFHADRAQPQPHRPLGYNNNNSNSNNNKNWITNQNSHRVQLVTLIRVGLPSIVSGVIATLTFPGMALFMAGLWNTNPGTLAVLSQDSSQFVQNFLTVAGLLFSILVGQTYYFLYTQQESLYYALFQEVTEAKSLLEQVALVCQGRSMYQKCLQSIFQYVQQDLKRIQADPAVLLSARPVDDPLEAIMYMTSVGIPSSVYETVKSLRAARAQRLGALQRKLPGIHMGLLWTLAAIELVSFPLLGAGTQSIGGYNILTIEGILFGVMTSGIVLTLRVVGELWRPAGGAYNVDAALSTMVRGLEKELAARVSGRQISSRLAPSGVRDTTTL